ncbi:hypothetical protein B0T18DRAFT_404017 [Schizothecium vesticola]|uniref:Pentatricopeptide repeat domain-containing protein n=1 Tax=Schizothecium vesticola TaxID=314040 RepID=A0AA40KAI3_9PEZI|nr:hypothetical protein B0T18DRAFT_404017 [Schizothecium vesticola]
MRRVSSPLRQLVQSRLNTLPRPRRSDEPSPATLPRSTELNVCLAAYSTTPSFPAVDPFAKLTFAATTRGLFGLLPAQLYQPAPQSAHYGKWESLSRDEARLLVETNLGERNQTPTLLVDLPENQNDFQLWLCILDFRRHRDGPPGAAAVMEGLMERGCLAEMEGESAVVFWQTLLSEACPQREMLGNVWTYGEWLNDKFGIRWPSLHDTVVSFFVEKNDNTRALQWHLRLSPNLGSDADTFAAMLKRLMDPAPKRQEILRMLYLASPHRRLYDEIIPFLYSQGQAEMARHWRQLLTAHGDGPHSSVSYPFLRYVSAYYPEWKLEPSESAVARFQAVAQEAGQHSEPAHWDLRYMVNTAHGEVFGIKEKTYNDELGARWFATAWVSIDSAINSLFMLGITCIGPLSLQSIALRELTAEGLARRIDQLRDSGISADDSTYAQALCHWAASGTEDLILDLIHSDMHPDVFEDPAMQRSIAISAIRTGDAARYRLIAAARSAVAEGLATRWSTQVLLGFLLAGNKMKTLKVLDTMHRRGIKLSLPGITAISGHICRTVPAESTAQGDNPPDVLFYACLCSMITSMLAPPSVEALRHVFFQLHHQRQVDEFKLLTRDVIAHYQRCRTTGRGFMPVLEEAIPERLQDVYDDARGPGLRQIPHDLHLNHSLHPLSLIFDETLQSAIVIQSFVNYDSTAQVEGQPPASPLGPFRFLDGIHHLKWLRQQGVIIHDDALQAALIQALSECDDGSQIFRMLCNRRVAWLMPPKHRRAWALQALRQIVQQILRLKVILPAPHNLEPRIQEHRQRTGSDPEGQMQTCRPRKSRTALGGKRGPTMLAYSSHHAEKGAELVEGG